MRHAAVAEFVSNFAQSKFVIEQEFLCLLDFLPDDVLLQGDPFNGREEVAQVIVFVVKAFGKDM